MWGYSFITNDWGADQLLLPQVLRGFPQVFAVAPAVNLGLGSLPPDRLKFASGLFNMMRNLGGAVGIALCGAILNSHTNAHLLDIASTLTPANGASQHLIAGMTHQLGALLGSSGKGHAAALRELRDLAYREASTMAYADAFRTLMLVCLGAACLVPLMKNIAHPPARSAKAH
jgi:DHA2 family multidrug resistance protein